MELLLRGVLLLQMRQVHKSFDGKHALSDVSLDIHAGEVHALMALACARPPRSKGLVGRGQRTGVLVIGKGPRDAHRATGSA